MESNRDTYVKRSSDTCQQFMKNTFMLKAAPLSLCHVVLVVLKSVFACTVARTKRDFKMHLVFSS